jgi:stringent starvation protein B
MNGNPPPPKKEVALALLERGHVSIHLDPRSAGVVVPAWFKRQPQLVLQVGYNMPVNIPDLRIDESGMSCTLSFNRSPFFCIVPWSSVYAMVGDDGRGMVWPEDVPPEVALQGRPRDEAAAKKPAPARSLAVVKSSDAAEKAPAKPRPRAARAERPEQASVARTTEKKPRQKRARADAPAARDDLSAQKGASEARDREDRLVRIPAASKTTRERAPSATSSKRPGETRRDATRAVTPPATLDGAGPSATKPAAASPPTPPPPTSPPATSGAGTHKPGKAKREIPPYLRVVK